MTTAGEDGRRLDAAFRAIAEGMPDSCAVCTVVRDAQGEPIDLRLDYVNPQACAVFGIRREELVGRNLCEVLPAAKVHGIYGECLRVVDTGEPLVKEMRLFGDDRTKKDSAWCPHRAYSIRASKYGDGLLVFWHELGAELPSEWGFEPEVHWLRVILERSLDGILVVDAQGVVRFANRAASQVLLGDTPPTVGSHFEVPTVGPHKELRVSTRDGERTIDVRTGAIAWGNQAATLVILRDVTSLRTEERPLLDQATLHRVIAETVNDAFWIATPGIGRTLYVSPAYDAIWGRPASELADDSLGFIESVHPDDRALLQAHLDVLHRDRSNSTVEYRILRPNGETRWIHERGFQVSADRFGQSLVAGVCTDVTERVTATQSRQKLEEMLCSAEELAHVGGWELDVARDELTLTEEYCRIHGIAERRIPRLELRRVVHPEDWQSFEELRQSVFERRGSQCDLHYRVDDGHTPIRRVACRVKIHRNDDGSPSRVYGFVQDVTEQTITEQALVASRDYLQHLHDAVGEAVFAIKLPEEYIESANRTAETIFGCTASELLGRHVSILHPDETHQRSFQAKLTRALAERQARFQTEELMRRRNGELFLAQITATFLLEAGEPKRCIAVIQDISERRRVETERAALVAADRAILTSANLRSAAERICALGKQLTGATLAFLATREAPNEYRVAFSDTAAEKLRVPLSVLVSDHSLLSSACRLGKAFFENDALSVPELEPLFHGTGLLTNLVFVPLIVESTAEGFMVLGNKPRSFTERDADRATSLAEPLSLALRHDRFVRALLDTQQLLTATGRLARVGGWELDARTKRVSWTVITRELHEVSEDYVPTLDSGLAFYAPDDRARLASAVENALTLGTPYDIELPLTTAKGSRLWVHSSGIPVLENGQCTRLIGAFEDVTQRKLAELAKADRDRLLTLITANIFDMVTLLDQQGRYTYVGESVAQLGYTPQDLVGKSRLDYIHEEDRGFLMREIAKTWKSSTQRRYEFRFRRADGTYCWLESISRVVGDDPASCMLIVSSRDITTRKSDQLALRAEKDRAQRYLDVAAIMLLGLDTHRRITLINPRGCAVLEASTPRELLGRDFLEFVIPTDRERVEGIFESVLSGTSETNKHIEYEIVTLTGSVKRVLWNNATVRDSENRAIGTLSSGEDVTERRALERRLAKADRLATMGLLAAGVAHEVNNPLSYVLSNLETLAEDLPAALSSVPERQEQHLGASIGPHASRAVGAALRQTGNALLSDILDRFNDTLAGARRIRDITRGLSAFSRVDASELDAVDLTQVVDLALNMTHNETKYRARVVKDYGPTPPVSANGGRLSQVFVNLLINAAHAIDIGDAENNEIRVTTWTDGNDVCAEVLDTGSGIAREHIDKLFDPFFTTKRVGGGSGLGLPISRTIIEGYGGTLEFHTEMGKGTRFTVRLPRRVQKPTSHAPQVEPEPAPTVSGRILIIDDDEGVRTGIARVLREHQLVQATGGADGMRILERDSDFDLVLCDVMMSDITGVDLHEWMLERDAALASRFVFMTGGTFAQRARRYLRHVENLRLEKPFDSANLRRTVNGRVARFRAGKPLRSDAPRECAGRTEASCPVGSGGSSDAQATGLTPGSAGQQGTPSDFGTVRPHETAKKA